MTMDGTQKQLRMSFVNLAYHQIHSVLLEEAGTTDYRKLITTTKGLKVVTRWLMKSGLVSQYSLVTQNLYQ